MTLRQAAQQALEALEFYSDLHGKKPDAKIIRALRAALAEPEQKVWCDCGDSIEPDSGAKCGNCVAGDSAGPEQEPVGWQWLDTANYRKNLPADAIREHWRPLYTAPTPRKPLTDEEMRECAQAMNAEPLAEGWPELIKFARAIESAHGIGEQDGS